ncbi:MAG: hypothetical protein JWR13_384 [Mycobacterium sp.]|jgi:hypothetical protein|nr:hypothetical protein [Mycobacterium sp.]MDT5312262.1 hypothetical protein [Mycobacterium sp.]
MGLSRLPIAVAPAHQETVASYLTRAWPTCTGYRCGNCGNRSALHAQVASGATSSPTGLRP